MRIYVRRKLLVVGACFISGLCAWGQAHSASASSNGHPVEVAMNFEAGRANTVPAYNFWMEGGGVQAAVKVAHHWSGAADISYLHAGQMPHTTVGLDLFTAAFGPRYSMIFPGGCFKIYGQAMGGAVHGSNSFFPNLKGATSSASGVALLVGGGIDYTRTSHMSIRIIDADWLRTELSNGTTTVQNSLRVSSGVALLF